MILRLKPSAQMTPPKMPTKCNFTVPLLKYSPMGATSPDIGLYINGTRKIRLESNRPIANTTPATALFSAYLGIPVEAITGRGSGIEESRVAHKAAVITRAMEVNAEHLSTPLGTLAAVGGLEIAGICGLILGASKERISVVVDGFISTAAAVAACALKPESRDYMMFSHMSREQGHRKVIEAMEAETLLDLELRLGEGTGAALAMQLIETAIRAFNEMATFSSAGVSGEPV